MFLRPEEMTTVIEAYRIDQMTDSDETILQQCILAAIKRVRSYLNAKYDTATIFNATGKERDPDILEICKNFTLWQLIRRNNIDMAYDRVKEVYDRDITYLRELGRGELSAELPLRDEGKGLSPRMGSNSKFRHIY